MPWLVSMRMTGQVMGARARVATRRSVILSSEGLDAVLVYCIIASRVLPPQMAAPVTPAAPFKKFLRDLRGFNMGPLRRIIHKHYSCATITFLGACEL